MKVNLTTCHLKMGIQNFCENACKILFAISSLFRNTVLQHEIFKRGQVNLLFFWLAGFLSGDLFLFILDPKVFMEIHRTFYKNPPSLYGWLSSGGHQITWFSNHGWGMCKAFPQTIMDTITYVNEHTNSRHK